MAQFSDVYNLCGPSCIHNDPNRVPLERKDDFGRRIVAGQTAARQTYEARRDWRNAESFGRAFAALGLAEYDVREGRPDVLAMLNGAPYRQGSNGAPPDGFNPDDARVFFGSAYYVVPCLATAMRAPADSPAYKRNFLRCDSEGTATILIHRAKGLWCLEPKAVVMQDLMKDARSIIVDFEEQKDKQRSEIRTLAAERHALLARTLDDVGIAVPVAITDGDLDLMWDAYKRGELHPPPKMEEERPRKRP